MTHKLARLIARHHEVTYNFEPESTEPLVWPVRCAECGRTGQPYADHLAWVIRRAGYRRLL